MIDVRTIWRTMHLIQYWSHQPVPEEIRELTTTFAELNAGMHYAFFDWAAADEFIAARYPRRVSSAFRSCAVPAMQADYFRYCAVLALGGIYADADMRCKVPLEPLLAPDVAGFMFRRPNGNINNNFFGFRNPGHPLLELTLEIATRAIEQRFSNGVWIVTGPAMFTFLHLLSTLSPREREVLEFDGILDVDAALSIRLCRDTCVERALDFTNLFDGVHVAPQVDETNWADDVSFEYKNTAVHWLNWPGSIYRDAPSQNSGQI